MSEVSTELGARLRRMRRERGWTQAQLAELSEVSKKMVASIEQGLRTPTLDMLGKLAKALGVTSSQLLGRHPELGSERDGVVLAIRDALQSPGTLPGVSAEEDGEAPPQWQLARGVADAEAAYWDGRFGALAAMLPSLIRGARARWREDPAAAARPLALSRDLAACVLVHFGMEDLASQAAERAVLAAAAGDDPLLHAAELGTFAWVMLHQDRKDEAERLAVSAADSVDPSAGDYAAAVHGSLLLTAVGPAAAKGEDAREYTDAAMSAARRMTRPRHAGISPFGPAQVRMQEVHALVMRNEPGLAMAASAGLHEPDLRPISWGRHLLDLAQAHVFAGNDQAAVMTLAQAREVSPAWFAHQGVAQLLVGDLTVRTRRMASPLSELATAVSSPGFAPYPRP